MNRIENWTVTIRKCMWINRLYGTSTSPHAHSNHESYHRT